MKFTNGKYSKIVENYHFIPKRGYNGTIGNFPPNSNLFNVVQRKTQGVVWAKKQRRAKCCAVSPGEQQMRGGVDVVIPLHREFVTRVSPWFMVISSLEGDISRAIVPQDPFLH